MMKGNQTENNISTQIVAYRDGSILCLLFPSLAGVPGHMMRNDEELALW